MLVRSFVGQRLGAYYAQSADAVVGSVDVSQVRLWSLLGEWHWKRVCARFYRQQRGRWLTPVELFKPFYSQILAEFIIEQCIDDELKSSVEIVELGGGRGTNAKLILDYLKEKRPDIYERTAYRIIDGSPTLHELQRQILVPSHADRVQLQCRNLSDVAEHHHAPFLEPSKQLTIVIALELLDNLPHDKIRVLANQRIEQAQIHQVNGTPISKEALVDDRQLNSNELKEVFVPLADPLLQWVLRTAPVYSRLRAPALAWIPTVACGVLQRVFQNRPNTRLLIADFDWLPPPDHFSVDSRRQEAEGEPLVTDMVGIDHPCYLKAPSLCDILFPTDFQKLQLFVKKISPRNEQFMVKTRRQSEFLQLYGTEQIEQTKSWLTGYTPLLHDFANCSVLSVTKE